MKSNRNLIMGMLKYSRNLNDVYYIIKENSLVVENRTAREGKIFIKEKDNLNVIASVYFDPRGYIRAVK